MEDKARLARDIMGDGYEVKATANGLEISKAGVANGAPVTDADAAKLNMVRVAIGNGVMIKLVVPKVEPIKDLNITVVVHPEVMA